MNNNRTLLIVSILHCFLGGIGAIFFLTLFCCSGQSFYLQILSSPT